jgi:hypothetical protein
VGGIYFRINHSKLKRKENSINMDVERHERNSRKKRRARMKQLIPY